MTIGWCVSVNSSINSGLSSCSSIEIVGTPVLGCPKKHRISKADTPGGVSLRDILIGVPNLKQLCKLEFEERIATGAKRPRNDRGSEADGQWPSLREGRGMEREGQDPPLQTRLRKRLSFYRCTAAHWAATIPQSKIKDFCQLPLHKGAFGCSTKYVLILK